MYFVKQNYYTIVITYIFDVIQVHLKSLEHDMLENI